MKILAILLFIASSAYAQDDQFNMSVGVGVFNSGKHSLSETKSLTIGYQEDLWNALKQRVTIGFWFDDVGNGRSSSAFGSGQLGFEVNRDGLVADIFFGPAAISSPDILLGGTFQFMETLNLGIQDKQNNYIGLFYRHLSSAGIEMPNIGRDLIGLEIRW